jgi:hypothetical protein
MSKVLHFNPVLKYPSYYSNEVIPSSQPPPPHPPRPSQGSPLMSTLMRGLQWTSHRPRIFRIPLLMSFNRPQQQQQTDNPTPQTQSLQRTYSTLYPQILNQQLQADSNYPQFNPRQQDYPFSQYPYAPQQQYNHAQSSHFPDQGQSSSQHQHSHEHSYGGYQEYQPQYNEQQEYNQGLPQYNNPQSMEIPDGFRPPAGFSYTHSESSPAVSMGTTTYDDPPVMMEMGGGGRYIEQPHPQQSSPNRESERRGSVLTPQPVPGNGMNLLTAQSSEKVKSSFEESLLNCNICFAGKVKSSSFGENSSSMESTLGYISQK